MIGPRSRQALGSEAEPRYQNTGAVMTMPDLLKRPAALEIDVDGEGRISGLF
jgi:formyltetrahydrofolate synthetase